MGAGGQVHFWEVLLPLTSSTDLWSLSHFVPEMGSVDSAHTGMDFYFVNLFKGFWIKWRIWSSYPYHCCIWPLLYFPWENSTGKLVFVCFSRLKSISPFILASILTSFPFSASCSLPAKGNCQFYFAHGNSHVVFSLFVYETNTTCINSYWGTVFPWCF